MSRTQVQYWHKRFREGDGHTPVTDLLRSGRPRSVRTPEAVQNVQAIVRADRRKSCTQMGEEAGVSKATVHRIVKQLGFKKKALKFVPRLLTDEQKRMRMRICAQNLKLLADIPNLLDFVVTGDESSIPLYDPETKLSSMHWLTKEEPCPQKALHVQAHSSTMVTTFFDSAGLFLIEFLPKGETITAETYCETLKTLKERIRRKRPALWSKSRDGEHWNFWLHHDNASSHTATDTLALIGLSDILMIGHPPYSPDLAPNDFFLYPTLKKFLRGIKHRNVEQLQESVRDKLKLITKEQFRGAMMEMPRRWTKCLNAQGDFFEGKHLDGDTIPPEIAAAIPETSSSDNDD